MSHAGFALLRAYARVAPTERGGYRLARAARRMVPRARWTAVFPTGNGVELSLDLATYPDVAMAAGMYELDTVRLLRRLVRPGMHVVDGGANIGFFTCRLARLAGPGGHVDAFEPDPLNRARLAENLARNRLDSGIIHVHPAALSDRAEHLSFHRPAAGARRNHGESGRFPRGDVPTERFEVTAARLDEAVVGVPDLVKLDLEGSELLAVRGATRWLASPRPPRWIIEHNPSTDAVAGHRPGDIWRALLEHAPRYRCRFIGASLRTMSSPEQLDVLPRQGNVLFSYP